MIYNWMYNEASDRKKVAPSLRALHWYQWRVLLSVQELRVVRGIRGVRAVRAFQRYRVLRQFHCSHPSRVLPVVPALRPVRSCHRFPGTPARRRLLGRLSFPSVRAGPGLLSVPSGQRDPPVRGNLDFRQLPVVPAVREIPKRLKCILSLGPFIISGSCLSAAAAVGGGFSTRLSARSLSARDAGSCPRDVTGPLDSQLMNRWPRRRWIRDSRMTHPEDIKPAFWSRNVAIFVIKQQLEVFSLPLTAATVRTRGRYGLQNV